MNKLKQSILISILLVGFSCEEQQEQPENSNTILHVDTSGLSNLDPTQMSPSSIKIGDYNADGRDDFLIIDGQQCHLIFSKGHNQLLTYESWPTDGEYGYGIDYTWAGDFAGDEADDLISIGHNVARLKISTGDGFVNSEWEMGTEITDLQYIFVGDFDNNGKDDIAMIHHSGRGVYVRLSNGTDGFIENNNESTQFWDVPWTDFTTDQKIFSGDYNGDGFCDIFFPKGNNVVVLESDGSGFAKKAYGVDVDGDGHAESEVHWGNTSYSWSGDTDGDGHAELVFEYQSQIATRQYPGSNTNFIEARRPYTNESYWSQNYAMNIINGPGFEGDEIVSWRYDKVFIH